MLNIIHNNENVAQVKSISAAWNKFREIRNEGGTGTLVAENDETKEIILDVLLKVNTKGKVEFRDRNKEDAKAAKKAVKRSAPDYEIESEDEPSTVEKEVTEEAAE